MTHTILVVDDSKLARMAVIRALRSLHPEWKCVEASNADETLVHISQESPDFVLLDFNMPGMDGLTLAQQLRQSNSRLNVAVVSANRQVEVIERTRAVGATFLPKPLTEEILKEFLDDGLQQLAKQ